VGTRGTHQDGSEHDRGLVCYRCTVVPVLPRHLFLEAGEFANVAWRSREDRADRRKHDDQGKISPHQLRAKQCWVFGIYDPSTKEGHIELVEQRDAATLLPIIQRIVAPGRYLVGRVGRVRSAVVTGLSARNSQPRASSGALNSTHSLTHSPLQGPRHRHVH